MLKIVIMVRCFEKKIIRKLFGAQSFPVEKLADPRSKERWVVFCFFLFRSVFLLEFVFVFPDLRGKDRLAIFCSFLGLISTVWQF